MGIEYLHKFISTEVPRGCVKINIRQEVEKWKKEHECEYPIIVIEMRSLLQVLLRNERDLLCGGRHQVYLELADQFFAKLRSLEVNLVFFCDGIVPDFKLQSWSKAQDFKYKKWLSVLKRIYGNTSLHDLIFKKRFGPHIRINSLIPGLKHYAKRYGQLITSITSDCRLEIAQYAKRCDAMAVIGFDADFLIFDGDWQFWCARNLNFDTLDTFHYDRRSFTNYLNLTSKQLPLFAVLTKNNIMHFNDLKNFQNTMGPHPIKFYNIADYVRTFKNLPINLTQTELQRISRDVYGYVDPLVINCLVSSIQSYNLNFENDIYVDPLLQTLESVIFSLLCDKTYNLTIVPYCDMSKEDIMPHYLLMMPIIKRQIGVLLQHENDPLLTRWIAVKRHPDEDYVKIRIQPQYPSFSIPQVHELFDYRIKLLDGMRWCLLCWMISDNLKPHIIQKIPPNYLVNILVLYFLIETNQLTILEADAFLLTIDEVNKGQIAKVLEYPKHLNERTTRLSFLFGDVYAHILRCLQIVGLTKYDVPLRLDGVYLHKLTEKLKICPRELYQIAIHQVLHYRIYTI